MSEAASAPMHPQNDVAGREGVWLFPVDVAVYGKLRTDPGMQKAGL